MKPFEAREGSFPQPKGCKEVKVPFWKKAFEVRRCQKAMREMNDPLIEYRNRFAYSFVRQVATQSIDERRNDIEFDKELGRVDPLTGQTYRRLLTQGVLDLKARRYGIMVESITDLVKDMKDVFVLGGIHNFKINSADSTRVAEGKYIGIRVNPYHSEFKILVDKSWAHQGRLFGVQSGQLTNEVINAVINTRINLLTLKDEEQGFRERVLSPEEILKAAEWVRRGNIPRG